MFRTCLVLALIGGFGLSAAYGAEDATQKLYDAKCSKCHGKDGKGLEKMAKVLKLEAAKLNLTGSETVKATDADLIKVVTDGRKKMPKNKGKLKASEIQALVQYIRSLAPAK